MRYRRQDGFRYQFEEPVACSFRILKVGNKDVQSKPGKASIYDLSEGGLKLTTPISIPLNQEIKVEVVFILNNNELKITGLLAWKKENISGDYSYGVDFISDKVLQRQMIEELKIYSKGIAVVKNMGVNK
ncbi:PilZ domain-containing protein [Bacillus sp. FJAT-45350]|uniref:PilZ domain-containing protein n=1 Tax=Bacillus sp. FJAT-45350 TaxID=2011014 RepID=UPI000BB6C0E1|nr:PilZ domain-containing protein [Bacillus sp. FJAT-45350]